MPKKQFPISNPLAINFYYIILFFFFLVSGFCGLLYQAVWIRLAFASFGITTLVLSVVISVFMLGIAAGTWLAGRYVAFLTKKLRISAIILYALAEFLIGVGGILVPKLFAKEYTFLLSVSDFNSFQYFLISALLLSSSLVPWCVSMGLTIPFMMAYIKEIDSNNTTGFSYLYIANVIGAIIGTIMTAVFLIELLGLQGTLRIAYVCNFGIATISFVIGLATLFYKGVNTLPVPEPEDKSIAGPIYAKLSEFMPILFMTGCTSMAMEVVWIRSFTSALGTTVYAYAAILAVYLCATWLGSRRYRRDASAQSIIDIPRLVGGLALYSSLPILSGDPRLSHDMPLIMTEYLSFPVNAYSLQKAIGAFITLTGIVPFCAVLGYLTPRLIDECSLGDPRQAGAAYAINVCGCIAGPLIAGYMLLPFLGIKFSLVLLALPFALYFLYYYRRMTIKDKGRATRTAILLISFLAVSIVFLSSFEERALSESQIVRRDHVATVISSGKGMDKRLLVNGIGMTSLLTITKTMAHVPLAIRQERPSSALVICFGMGTTFRSVASWDIKNTAVELVPSVRDAFGYYFEDAQEVVANRNNQIVVDDGRRFLMKGSMKFDVITIDPPPPIESSGSSLLYSTKFYDIIKAHLVEGGILAQWFPGGEKLILNAVSRSITSSFPYVRVFQSIDGWGYHFFASSSPFTMPSTDEFIHRLPRKAAADFVEWSSDKDPGILYSSLMERELPLKDVFVEGRLDIITDDRPFNEYFLLRRIPKIFRNIQREH